MNAIVLDWGTVVKKRPPRQSEFQEKRGIFAVSKRMFRIPVVNAGRVIFEGFGFPDVILPWESRASGEERAEAGNRDDQNRGWFRSTSIFIGAKSQPV